MKKFYSTSRGYKDVLGLPPPIILHHFNDRNVIWLSYRKSSSNSLIQLIQQFIVVEKFEHDVVTTSILFADIDKSLAPTTIFDKITPPLEFEVIEGSEVGCYTLVSFPRGFIYPQSYLSSPPPLTPHRQPTEGLGSRRKSTNCCICTHSLPTFLSHPSVLFISDPKTPRLHRNGVLSPHKILDFHQIIPYSNPYSNPWVRSFYH